MYKVKCPFYEQGVNYKPGDEVNFSPDRARKLGPDVLEEIAVFTQEPPAVIDREVKPGRRRVRRSPK